MSEAITVEISDHVAVVEIHRGPHNFFDEELLGELATTMHGLDADGQVRCIVLCSEGKNFCAGAQLGMMTGEGIRRVYQQAFRLFTTQRPVVAVVQGSAVGGGLGLAMSADFRVATPETKFTANFARLGFHQGFGLSVSLPTVVGSQKALEMLYTGQVVSGAQALDVGLCDRLVEADPRSAALELAAEIAHSAPQAVAAIRATMRRSLIADVFEALDLEARAQAALLKTADFREGIDAARIRRVPEFTGE